MANVDTETVAGFGDEWSRFTQSTLSEEERQRYLGWYFGIFPWDALPPSPVGADFGCGSGRWAALVAPRVGKLYLVDASADALAVARKNLHDQSNVEFVHATVDDAPIPDDSLDFAYSLGVLHHVPDTRAALRSIVRRLRVGAPCLLYLYYAFDNRPPWYRWLWRGSELGRRVVSRLPHGARYAASQAIAATTYWPLARTAALLDRAGRLPPSFPLAAYRDASFYTMRTDALDRFGTRLEQRFTAREIEAMMVDAGLTSVRFSDSVPYWVACGVKR